MAHLQKAEEEAHIPGFTPMVISDVAIIVAEEYDVVVTFHFLCLNIIYLIVVWQ